MSDKKKYTVEDILELYDATKQKYDESGVFGQFDEDEKYYELDFANLLEIPKEFEADAVVLPTARDIVDSCVDHTDIANVRVWANRKGFSAKSEDESEMLRKFALGVLYRNNVEASIAPIRAGAKHYWMHGITIFKTVWDADRYMDKPERKEGESEDAYASRIDDWRSEHYDSIPIVIQAVNPRNILLDPYYDGGLFIFEVRDELCLDVKNKFGPKWSNPQSKKISDTVEHISFWTKDVRCELYDREPVLKVAGGVAKHKYGFIPYVMVDSGLGNISSDRDMKKRYVGVLRYIRKMLVSESRDYSVADIVLKKSAFPWGYLEGPNAASVTTISQKYGDYQAMPDGVKIVDMAPKVPPEALLQWLSVAAGYVSAHAAPNVTRGMGEQGVRSGADRRLLLAEASTRYVYSNEALRNGVAKVLSNCARIMKNVVPGNINVWARTPVDEFDIEIKKDQMKEPFTFFVEFSSISEEDEYRRHDDLERLMQSTLVTKQWARKQMSNVDPKAMEVEEEKERLKADPMFRQLLSQYATAKLMEALQKRSTADSMENPPPPIPLPMIQGQGGPTPQGGQPAQGGQAGRRMAAPIPQMAPLGSAEDLRTKMQNMRSQTPMNPMQGRGGGGNR